MKVCCAVVSDNHSEIIRNLDGSSIFTVEANAIDTALNFIADYEITCKFVIFSVLPLGFKGFGRGLMLWLFVGPTRVYLLDFFCSGIQFN